MNKSVHPVDERLPLGQTFLYGLQHVLTMYAGAVAITTYRGECYRSLSTGFSTI